MSRRRRNSGFSLRDLFVLIACAALLMTLIMLWVGAPRDGGGRRAWCANNMLNLSHAMLYFAKYKHRFPGYVDRVGAHQTSYIVPILPFIERADLYREFTSADPADAIKGQVYMSYLVCPSNIRPHSGTPLSYAVNAGQADLPEDASQEMKFAGGVCSDQTDTTSRPMDIEFIAAHDGTAQTILLTENVQSTSWAETDPLALRRGTTFLWWADPPQRQPQVWRINVGRNDQVATGDLRYARPSSMHAGGVNVAYCDGHLKFLADDIDYRVYKQLMTPDGAASGDDGSEP